MSSGTYPFTQSYAALAVRRKPRVSPVSQRHQRAYLWLPQPADCRKLVFLHDHVVVPQQRALGLLQLVDRDVVVGEGLVLEAAGISQPLLRVELELNEGRRQGFTAFFTLVEGQKHVGLGEGGVAVLDELV